jgi:hypothetical protein
MKSKQIISPFPDNISRELFGAYISGFVDGEGCFALGINSTTQTPIARFLIQLRSDDVAVLKLVQSYFQCGVVSVSGRKAYYMVVRLCYLSDIIVPHFEKFPLFAKKKRDLSIWKNAVSLAATVSSRKRKRFSTTSRAVKKWTSEEHRRFCSLINDLRNVRKFEECQYTKNQLSDSPGIFLFDAESA